MEWTDLSEWLPLILGAAVAMALSCAGLAAALIVARRRWASCRKALEDLREQQDAALDARAGAIRLLRLSSEEIRAPALSLHGISEQLRENACPETVRRGEAIASVSDQLLDIADDLQDFGVPTGSRRAIHDEALPLGPLVMEAVASLQASLQPGRRNWRVAPELAGLTLVADRRAVRQVLMRVLGNAARYTRNEDWIDISVAFEEDWAALVVEDEGAGTGTDGREPEDGRGVALGLALPKTLIEAHGGHLTIEATPRVGTRTTIAFPACRFWTPAET